MWGFISNTCDDLLIKIRTVLWQKIIITDDYTLSIFAILMKVLWFKDLLNNYSHSPLTKDNTILQPNQNKCSTFEPGNPVEIYKSSCIWWQMLLW